MNPSASLDEFELKVENHLAQSWRGVIGFGAPLPTGFVDESAAFHFVDRSGQTYPASWRALKSGAKESWAYFTFPCELRKLEFRHFKLQSGEVSSESKLELEQSDGAITVRNGVDEICFDASSTLGLSSLSRGEVNLIAGESEARIETDDVLWKSNAPLQLSVLHANDFEIVIQAQGELPADSDESDGLWVRLRYTIQWNRPGFALNALFSNRRKSDEELTLRRLALSWELGAPVESTIVKQLSTDNLCLAKLHCLDATASIRDGRLEDLSALEMPAPGELYPFFKRMDREKFFSRVAPFLGLHLNGATLIVSSTRAAHLEANSLGVHTSRLTLEPISPGANGRRVPQGFSRSFDFTISVYDAHLNPDETLAAQENADYRPLATVHPRWFAACEVDEMARIIPYRPDVLPAFEQQMWREWAKGYFSGFYHAGDWASGRGSAQMHAEASGYTWNNNEEDNLKGIAWMLMRTGDPSYAEDLRVCARHLIEVDRVDVATHPLQDGIMLAHSLNHFDGTGYPSHCWAEGLLLYYKLTGDDDALETFFGVCECLLRWIDTPDAMRFADAREMGVPITNFSHAYVLTGEQKWIDAARVYIARLQQQMDEDGGLYYKFSGFGGRLALYSEYVAVEGLWDFYELVGGDDVRELLLRIIEWIDRYALDAFGNYDARGTSESMFQPFFIAYKLTGDEAWLERGRRGLRSAIGQPSGLPLLKFNNNAPFLKEAFERGWINDEWVSLWPPISQRAVNRTYATPTWTWEKLGILYKEQI